MRPCSAWSALRSLAGGFALCFLPALAAAQTPIHDVQGSGSLSPLVGQVVIVRGIVTARRSNGFFVQAADADADADAATSEAIFVFTSSAPTAAATVGNQVQVVGTVTEFVPGTDALSPPFTELVSPTVSVLSTGNPLPTAVPLSSTLPSAAGALDQLERLEAMRVSVPRLTVVAPTQGTVLEANASATSTGVFFGVVEGRPRPFREPGIPNPDPAPAGYGSIPPIPRWDFNPELLRIDSDGQAGVSALNVSSGATVTGLTGPLDFVNRRFTILPDAGAVVESDLRQATAVPVPQSDQYTVANLHAQRLYDNVASSTEPVVSLTGYNMRLGKLSRLVRDMMREPDIIAVQEVENLATLNALAARITSDAALAGAPDPAYVAYLVEGVAATGLDIGFLVKTALVAGAPRVNVTSVTQRFAATTMTSPHGVVTLLYDTPPLELVCSVRMANGETQPLTVLNCQFLSAANANSTTSDVDWGTIGHRTRTRRYQQAAVLASHLQSLQGPAADPARAIVVAGDMAAMELNDGLGDLLGVLCGTPVPDAETATPDDAGDLVTPDFTNLALAVAGAERYQTVQNGAPQTAQHVLVSRSLVLNTSARALQYVRACADFPETARNTPGTPTRATENDPLVAFFTKSSAVAVEPGRPAAFGLLGVQPNPARGPVRVRFALAAGDAAALELFDLAGRRLETHRIDRAAAGEQAVLLANGRPLRPGVYEVRLTQGRRHDATRLLVVR